MRQLPAAKNTEFDELASTLEGNSTSPCSGGATCAEARPLLLMPSALKAAYGPGGKLPLPESPIRPPSTLDEHEEPFQQPASMAATSASKNSKGKGKARAEKSKATAATWPPVLEANSKLHCRVHCAVIWYTKNHGTQEEFSAWYRTLKHPQRETYKKTDGARTSKKEAGATGAGPA
ncbi:uncharacterized protein BXZ73DRAFT_75167 [Epithele typhae]|uniref:uncharacterized protein n=1 Tax=Epithele typhae TaxID=378194 RepID=UPI002008C403|nr:uncharacterized protein BXZ73DRAFT_75167 [Epithele typhae]KAH9941204.1 hypothetical protein BXZ73DRAFT_75167 [Epithele typhae]